METKAFSRIVTAILFNDLLTDCKGFKDSIYLELVTAKYQESIRILKEYVRLNIDSSSMSDEIKSGLLELAMEKGLFDKQHWEHYLNVKHYAETYGFLAHIKTPYHWDEKEKKMVKKLINQILLFKKKYYDGKDYEMVLVEEVKEVEEVVEEEAI
jgi:hypothetical protein